MISGTRCCWTPTAPSPRRSGVKRPGPLINRRVTVVIDTDRRVREVIASETNMDTHADRSLAVLRAARLRTGERSPIADRGAEGRAGLGRLLQGRPAKRALITTAGRARHRNGAREEAPGSGTVGSTV